MAGWHHRLNGREWTLEVGDGQVGLACCDSWGHKESDTTERLNWTELNDRSFQKIIFSEYCGTLSLYVSPNIFLMRNKGDFPGDPEVKNMCFHCSGHRFNSWLEKYDPTCNRVWPRKNEENDASDIDFPCYLVNQNILILLMSQYS